MKLTTNDALATVRQAYEYIEQYQRHVLDAFTMIERDLVGFTAHRRRIGSSFAQARLGAFQGFLPRDFEMSWARGPGAEGGVGTYVVVRHVADTADAANAASVPDTVLHAMVLHPIPGFTKDAFSLDWQGCAEHHFPSDAQKFGTLDAGDAEGGSTERGWWYLHVFSLASVVEPGDFAEKFVKELVAKAVMLSQK